MIVKSARTKKFDGEIDLTFKNGGLESSIIYILIIVQNLGEFQAIYVICSICQIMIIYWEFKKCIQVHKETIKIS